MKKVIALVLSLVLCLSLFAGCGKVDDAKVIKVAASPTPHALILKTVADVLEYVIFIIAVCVLFVSCVKVYIGMKQKMPQEITLKVQW